MNMSDNPADIFDLMDMFKNRADWFNEDMDYETNDVFNVHSQRIGDDIVNFFRKNQDTSYRF